MIIDGNVWKYGNDVGCTDIVPARHDKAGMQRDWDECSKHLLEDLDPTFAGAVQRGDVIVGGTQLGAGHAHYYMAAIMGIYTAGVSAFLADSVAALYFRAAIDAGMAAWSYPGISDFVSTGDRLHLDLRTGHAENRTTGAVKDFGPVSSIVLDILDAGGADAWALRRVGAVDAADKADHDLGADPETENNSKVTMS